MYDSKEDTIEHINKIKEYLDRVILELENRKNNHDKTKLEEPEKSIFDEFTPKLKGSIYGTVEYNEMLNEMKVALKHHYSHNSHHPEYYNNGIDGFNLIDLIEMFCDWMAAVKRHANGSIFDSIEINKKRFNISDQLCHIFNNTTHLLDNI